MRTVFTNHMCAHVWAQQSQEHGRSGSTHFERDVFFSYSTPIARILPAVTGPRVMFLTCFSYSMTTAQHKSGVRSAFDGDVYVVPSLGISAGRHREPWRDGWPKGEPYHDVNLAYLMEQYESLKSKLKRMRSEPYDIADSLAYEARNAEGYALAFGLTVSINLEQDAADIAEYRTARNARLSTPEHAAKLERARVAREAREQEKYRVARLESIERIALWRAGNRSVRLGYQEMRDAQGSAMLRIVGDTVETSQGATVPLDHALRVYRAVKRCHDTGTAWEPNGHTLHVGHFTVNRISADGDIWAGCHRINWAEVEAFGRLAVIGG